MDAPVLSHIDVVDQAQYDEIQPKLRVFDALEGTPDITDLDAHLRFYPHKIRFERPMPSKSRATVPVDMEGEAVRDARMLR